MIKFFKKNKKLIFFVFIINAQVKNLYLKKINCLYIYI